MKNLKKQGVTLIELIVAIAISSIIIVPITSLLISISTIYKASERLSTAQAYSNLAMDVVKRELSTAISGNVSSDTSDIVLNPQNPKSKKRLYTNSDGVIILNTKTTISNTNIQVLKKPDLDGLNMKCNLTFQTDNNKSVTVNVIILDKATNTVIYKLTSIVFSQNTPNGFAFPPSKFGTVVIYEYPS